MNRRSALLLGVASLAACSDGTPAAAPVQQAHSSAMAVSPDGTHLFVAEPDADSVSIINLHTRAIEHQVLLAPAAPAVDPTTQRFDPAVGPRSLALDSHGRTLFVTGQRSGHLYAIDTASATVKADAAVCAEPIGVLVSADDINVFVACSQDDTIAEVRASDLSAVASIPSARKPWALAWAADGRTLIASHFLGPSLSVFSTEPLAAAPEWAVADSSFTSDPATELARARSRDLRRGSAAGHFGDMDGAPDVGDGYAPAGSQFPGDRLSRTSIFDPSGNQITRLSVSSNPGDNGAFGDIVSGPRALAFSGDGKFAFIVDADSEDLLVVDADARIETQIIRPMPGHLPDAVVCANGEIYVHERNSEDIVAFRFTPGDGGFPVVADGSPFASLLADPMPANLRLGQKLFFSANSDDVPVTQNHWVACASCHLEGRSDAVTRLLRPGPTRHPDERWRHARHRLSVPYGRPNPSPRLLEDDRRGAGRALRQG